MRFPLPDTAVDLVVMDADGKPDFQIDLTMVLVRDGAFISGLALVVIGLGVGVAGLLLLRRAPRRGRRRAARAATTRAVSSGTPGRRRRGVMRAAAATVTALLAGCGVPHHRAVEDLSKPGASLTEADSVLGSYVHGVTRLSRPSTQAHSPTSSRARCSTSTRAPSRSGVRWASRDTRWRSATPRRCGRRGSTRTRCGSSRWRPSRRTVSRWRMSSDAPRAPRRGGWRGAASRGQHQGAAARRR